MAKWKFLEDFKLKHNLHGMMNTDFIVRVEPRLDTAEMVIFFGAEGHADPHIMTFESGELCQKAYDDLKAVLKTVTYTQNAMPLGALFYECLLTFL